MEEGQIVREDIWMVEGPVAQRVSPHPDPPHYKQHSIPPIFTTGNNMKGNKINFQLVVQSCLKYASDFANNKKCAICDLVFNIQYNASPVYVFCTDFLFLYKKPIFQGSKHIHWN